MPRLAIRQLINGQDDGHPEAWLALLAVALPSRPERRAARILSTANEQAFIDGHPVTFIDVSTVGAQVRSPTVLRPRQRVRLVRHRKEVR